MIALPGGQLSIDWITEKIEEIETLEGSFVAFIPARYPYTYAYDYMRSHGKQFPGLSSRADCADVFRLMPTEEARQCCELLADAYLRQWNIKKELP